MKTKFNGILTLLLALVVQITFAQSKTISGTVSDESGPLPGVNVIIKGTATGTETDFDGNYTIKAKTGDVLVFSFVGMETVEKVVGSSNRVNVTMQADSDNVLDEVVVTAFGVSKEKRALSYATSVVESESIQNKPETDIAASLNGKVAGVNIVRSGGVAGSGSNVTIRGLNSIAGNNQPLWVVDGIPIDGGSNQVGDFSTGAGTQATSSSRFLDIDPNSIESVNVLKGLSASVLYGSRGRNGVIIVTTKNSLKSGKSKTKISLNASSYISTVANLPDYQNTYGQGADFTLNPGFVGNWGARFADDLSINHPYNQSRFADVFPQFQGVVIPYEAVPDNVENFFQRGFGQNYSINYSQASESSRINFGFGYTDEDGFVRKNNLRRVNASIGGQFTSGKFNFGGALNYVRTNVKTPPIAANNVADAVSVFVRTLFIPRNLDLANLPFQNPIDGSNVYYRTDQENPYWLLNNSGNTSVNNRIFGNFKTTLNFNENIRGTYIIGYDTYTDDQRYFINKGGVSSNESTVGYLRDTQIRNTILTQNLNFSGSFNLTDKLDLDVLVGGDTRSDQFRRSGIASTQQITFGVLQHDNFSASSGIDPITEAALDFESRVNLLGIYASLEFNWDNHLFLTLQAKNEWASNLEIENNSQFYPSVGLSFIPTTAFKGFKSDAINFLKLRASFASSAEFPTAAFITQPRIIQNPIEFDTGGGPTPGQSVANLLPNPDLKASLWKEVELGLEANLFNRRVSLNASVFSRNIDNQIVEQNLDPSTGASSFFTNLGKVVREGVEVDLGVTPIKSDNGFNWKSNFVFYADESEVSELNGDVFIDGFSGLGNIARNGKPLGAIIGSRPLRDDNGGYIISPGNGKIIKNDDVGLDNDIIGDPNPDWKITNINTISYKGLSLSAQVEYTHGGDFYSTTIPNLLRRGVTTDTENREGTFVIPGIYGNPNTGEPLLDSNGEIIPNNIQLSANDLYFLNLLDADSQNIFDGSVWRLREVSLTYNLPKSIINQTPFNSISFTASGQNLWFWAPNVPRGSNFDPETISTGVGNGAGLEFGTTPTQKRIGFTVKATF